MKPSRALLDAFSSRHNDIKPYQTMTKWPEESISTFRGSTEGSFVRKVWNWLQMVVHRLLGESMGRASMKVAMLSRQCSIVPPAGRLFLLLRPWRAQRHKPGLAYIKKFYKQRYFHLTGHSVLIHHSDHDDGVSFRTLKLKRLLDWTHVSVGFYLCCLFCFTLTMNCAE